MCQDMFTKFCLEHKTAEMCHKHVSANSSSVSDQQKYDSRQKACYFTGLYESIQGY